MSEESTLETIVAVAIKDTNGKIWTLPKPNRHHDVINVMYFAKPDYTVADVSPVRQGFITSENRFVGRLSAMKIAQAANQLIDEPHDPRRLFSEDVW